MNEKILVLGYDGYIGYPLTINLIKQGYEVSGIDCFLRRGRARTSLTPIKSINERYDYLSQLSGGLFQRYNTHLAKDSPMYLRSFLGEVKPDVIIHLAEQPSAPWSMKDPFNAATTQFDNVIGTLSLLWCMKEECPEAHLIKLGTMGEYGTPNCDIPEGRIPPTCIGNTLIDTRLCPMSSLLFPRTPGSFYHASKVMDTINIEFSCRNWNFRSTDIMQGVVFGLDSTDENELTRFDYDEHFGTCINRFIAQVLAQHPLTIYGTGNQTRGWLSLKDSIDCINLIIQNPPDLGTYRTINQFGHIRSINQLARAIIAAAGGLEIPAIADLLKNPRNEAEKHYYNPSSETLKSFGYRPRIFYDEIVYTLESLLEYRGKVIKDYILPTTEWS